MGKKLGTLMMVALVVLFVAGCAASPKDKFNAWLPKLTAACKQSSEAKALIKAASSEDEKRKIKTEQLDKANAALGELQGEYKGILSSMPEADRAQAEEQVQKILAEYGVS